VVSTGLKTAVLVSGGVDSAVALHMLATSGRPVTAFYIKIWLEDELAHLGNCPWEEDLQYVRAVCAQLNVPLEVVSLQKEYWDQVVAYTIAEVKAGRTPNPDVLCNSRIKFGAFVNAIDPSFARIASGHYARIERNSGGIALCVTPDKIKDQTYFLSQLTPQQLARLEFPLGNMTKADVRAYAHQHNLPNKDRKDSQGICFLGSFKFKDFIAHHVGVQKGPLIEWETKQKLGTHDGFWFYTIGQRQGLGLGGGPWYVVDKDPVTNTVFISRNYYSDDKVRDQFAVRTTSWLGAMPEDGEQLRVKLRHGPHYHEAQLFTDQAGYRVKLATDDQGIAAGQFAAFYRGDQCIGSGVIERC
jgi:tRNA (5-methylaminomethyl-2-thiouridylate)-methyltransferase